MPVTLPMDFQEVFIDINKVVFYSVLYYCSMLIITKFERISFQNCN